MSGYRSIQIVLHPKEFGIQKTPKCLEDSESAKLFILPTMHRWNCKKDGTEKKNAS